MEENLEQNIVNEEIEKAFEHKKGRRGAALEDVPKFVRFKKSDPLKYRYENSKWFRRFVYVALFMGIAFFFTQSGFMGLVGNLIIACIPLFMGFGIAWILNPMKKVVSKIGLSNKSASLVCYIISALIVVALGLLIIPFAIEQGKHFIERITADYGDPNGIRERALRFMRNDLGFAEADAKEEIDRWLNYIKNFVQDFGSSFAMSALSQIGTTMVMLMMGLTIGYYLLADYDKYISNLKLFIRERDNEGSDLLSDIHKSLMGWFKGWIVDQGFIFIGTLIVLFFFGVEQWLILAIIMVICNLIPFVGPFIGIGVLGSFIIVNYFGIDTPATHAVFGYNVNPAVLVIGSIAGMVLVQTIESVVIIPIAYNKTTKIHPVTILISVAIVSAIFSPFLTPLTIPAIGVIKVFIKHRTGVNVKL